VRPHIRSVKALAGLKNSKDKGVDLKVPI